MLKQAYLINTDLKMDKGKIGVQTAHGAIQYMAEINERKSEDPMVKRYKEWKAETPDDPIGEMRKYVLKSTQDEMIRFTNHLMLKRIWAYPIFDKGYTQVDQHSLTCLVVEPVEENVYNELFGSLKLL